MKRIQITVFALALSLTIAILSCNEPLQIGTELFTNGDVDFVSTDTFTIEALTTQLDSTIAYDSPDFIFTKHRLGWVTDPIFGNHRSDLVAQLVQENGSRPRGDIDSVTLSIKLDTLDTYGNANASYNFEVFVLNEALNAEARYYTDDDLTAFRSLGSLNGYQPLDSDSIEIVEITSFGVLDTIEVPNEIRFRLNNFLGNLLFSIDSAAYAVRDSFLNRFNGIIVKPSFADGAMLPIEFSRSKVSVFYKNEDQEPSQYDYFLSGAAFSLHDHNYSTGSINGSIDDIEQSKDFLYLQGAGGPSISVKFPYIQSLSNIVVNEAILELTTELLTLDDRTQYPLPTQLYAVHQQDSLLVLTSDFSFAIQGFGDERLAGGTPEEGTGGLVYRFNISEHIQNMINGTVSDELFIQLAQSSTSVERAVFNGINNPDSPIRLKITYTEN